MELKESRYRKDNGGAEKNASHRFSNAPSYEDVLRTFGLDQALLTQEAYKQYIETLEAKLENIETTYADLESRIEALANQYHTRVDLDTFQVNKEGFPGSHTYRLTLQSPEMLFWKSKLDITQTLLAEIRKQIDSLLLQEDLFANRGNHILVADQLDGVLRALRVAKFEVSSLYTNGLWQSAPSAVSQSGVQPHMPGQDAMPHGRVVDYARFSLRTSDIEERFRSMFPWGWRMPEDERGNVRYGIDNVLASSAMAALQTVYTYIRGEGIAGNTTGLRYAFPSSGYFENISNVDSYAGGAEKIRFDVDEHGIAALLESDPDVILLEPFTNDLNFSQVDIAKVLRRDAPTKRRMVIIDYTSSGVNLDLYQLMYHADADTTLVFVTSLQKVFQNGDDMVPGGMMTICNKQRIKDSPLIDASRMCNYRAMIGALPTTSSLQTLDIAMDAEQTIQRSTTIGRNVIALAREIEALQVPPVVAVHYAPANENGASQVLWFYIELKRIANIKGIMKLAAQQGIQITQGASFGFNTTRIGAANIGSAVREKRLLRVCPGIESAMEMRRIARLFKDILSESRK